MKASSDEEALATKSLMKAKKIKDREDENYRLMKPDPIKDVQKIRSKIESDTYEKSSSSQYNLTSSEIDREAIKDGDNSNFTGVRLDTTHAQFAKVSKMNKKIEPDNSNFTGVRLDTSHAPFAKKSKMSKHIKEDKTLVKNRHQLSEESDDSKRRS